MPNDGRDDEINALKDAIGINPEKIAKQIAGKNLKEEKPTEPVSSNVESKEDKNIKEQGKVEDKKEIQQDAEAIRAAMLNEMFGEQFQTVEDVRKANIPAQLKELDNLREKVQQLEAQLKEKPKHSFANDELAKFNEFVRDTGIKSFDVFSELNSKDIASMDDMDALVLFDLTEDPKHINNRQRVRKYFERKYDVDKAKVEAGEMTQEEYDANMFNLEVDARKAKAELQKLKDKIKMPEIPEEKPELKEWTPEIKQKQKEVWSKVCSSALEQLTNVPIRMNDKDGNVIEKPLINYVLPEKSKVDILNRTIDYIIGNQIEVNEKNVKDVIQNIYSDIILNNFGNIMYAVFDYIRGMTEKEILETYHNPSPMKNKDQIAEAGKVDFESKREAAFQAEMNR